MAYAIPMIEPQTRKHATAYTGISWTFVYNAWHYHSLLARGFRPARQAFGEATENVIRMGAGDNDNLDEIFDDRKPSISKKFRLATPKLSESLIDDARQEPYFRK